MNFNEEGHAFGEEGPALSPLQNSQQKILSVNAAIPENWL